MKKDRKEEIKKLRREREGLTQIIKMMGEISDEPKFKYMANDSDLLSFTSDIGRNLNDLEDKQVKELSNMLEQFIKLLNDYLKENNIEIERF